MFRQARMQLTGWYLLIITSIVVIFSVVIMRLVNIELSRATRNQRLRLEKWQIVAPPNLNPPPLFLDSEEEIELLRQRIMLAIFITDILLIFVCGGASYLLAGKTLSPIEQMMLRQKRFVADSSHELRTPLTALRTSMEVALRTKQISKEDALALVNENLREVIRLQELSDSLLELSSSMNKLLVSSVVVDKILNDVLHTLSSNIKEKSIRIEKNNPKLSLLANKDALTRVLTIVLDNAIKYSQEKGLISISIRDNTINITDNGQGIAKENLDKVFERFFREDAARNSHNPGYGLGLSIAKELMNAQSGEIYIDSEVGVGTTVSLHLPTSA